jgi:hypothetical protein
MSTTPTPSRSPNYPQFDLESTIRFLQQLEPQVMDRPAGLSRDEVFAALGHSAASASAKAKVGALHQFGLLARLDGREQITPLGRQLLDSTLGAEDRLDALQEAALTPKIFRDLHDWWSTTRHGHARPSQSAVRRRLLDLGLTERGALACRQAFNQTLAAAQLPIPSEGRSGTNHAEGRAWDMRASGRRFTSQTSLDDEGLSMSVVSDGPGGRISATLQFPITMSLDEARTAVPALMDWLASSSLWQLADSERGSAIPDGEPDAE